MNLLNQLLTQLQSQSDETSSTFHPRHSEEKAKEPETYTDTNPNTSKQVITMTSRIRENPQMTNSKQTVATHSHHSTKDQVRIISSDERYTIADASCQSSAAN